MKPLLLSLILCISTLSCMSTKESQYNSVPFEEQMRTNIETELPEVMLINNMQELTELYTQLQDPQFPRSAPIPIFDENTESMVVLSPKLNTYQFGDIEILDVKESNESLMVNYKETPNWEYADKKQTNPIVIIKVNKKAKKVKLNLN